MPDKVLEKYSINDRLRGLAAKDRLEGLSIEEIMAWLKTHQADKDSKKFLNSVHSDSDNNPTR